MEKNSGKLTAQNPPFNEAKGLICLGLSIPLFLSLVSFAYLYPDKNFLGLVGYYISLGLNYVFGIGSYLILGFMLWMGWQLLTKGYPKRLGIKSLIFLLMVFSICLILTVIADANPLQNPLLQAQVYSEVVLLKSPYTQKIIRFNLGGVPAYFLYNDLSVCNLKSLLSPLGTLITFSITSFVLFLLVTEYSLISGWNRFKSYATSSWRLLSQLKKGLKYPPVPAHEREFSYNKIEKALSSPIKNEKPWKTKPEIPPSLPSLPIKPLETVKEVKKESFFKKTLSMEPAPKAIIPSNVEIVEPPKPTKMPLAITLRGSLNSMKMPPLNLLTSAKKVDKPTLNRDLTRQAAVLEETLMSFGIEAKVGKINCGPTITSFEVHPAVGVKVQKIKALENDIALNLEAKSMRIIAPIPGKAAVGVEVPSLYPQEVGFKEMLSNYQAQGRKCHIPVLLGKTVSGEDVVCDLTKMPHCIIAGATGSGKSVCINTIVMSILMNSHPDEVRLLLIDPKKVELSAYAKLPHMIAPVITEPHGAYAALQWLVKEMQARYEILKVLGLRNIAAFNNRKINLELEQSLDLPIPEKLPFIVAIIDEFADLMMASSSDLETPIARIAQMARAIGIHLILATQRPSREVITGLIKANFPTRIAFKVSSRINSQIILDENGAESLLGNGDLLFMPPGSSQLIRAQGAYIRDEDINRIIDFHCQQSSPNYLIKSFDNMSKDDFLGSDLEEQPKDTLYEQAVSIVVASRNASTTFLQRKLKIGYARAASLMDELEARGVVGPQEGSRPRKVYTTGQSLSSHDPELALEDD